MENKKTGVSMCGHIININSVKSTKATCSQCVHCETKGKTRICRYYDRIDPHRSKCVRFCSRNDDYSVSPEELERIKIHNERVKLAKRIRKEARRKAREIENRTNGTIK